MKARKYDSTVARIAGNLLSGDAEDWLPGGGKREHAVRAAVETARAIVAEVERTEPKDEPVVAPSHRHEFNRYNVLSGAFECICGARAGGASA